MKIQICPRGCEMTDRRKENCPRCGAFMKEIDEKDKDSYLRDVRQRQRESVQDAGRGRYVSNQRFL